VNQAAVLETIWRQVRDLAGPGHPVESLPLLAEVDPTQLGIALAPVSGGVCGVGDWRTPFTIQSVSKVFSLTLVLAAGGDRIWERVGREPSTDPFNSLIQLEVRRGVPRNPFVNSGALVVVDELLTQTGDACGAVVDFLRTEAGDPSITVDQDVVANETATSHRNAAMAHLIAAYGNMHNPVRDVLEHYIRICAITMTCASLASATAFLARHGVLADGTRLLSRSQSKRINAVMLTCGAYDAAGEFAYRVGLPVKSGVSGAIVAVVPSRCALCVWSPGVDEHGNSLAGVAALDAFTTRTGWSVF